MSFAQVPVCKDLHEGIYYTYWQESSDHFVTIMKGNRMTEIAVNLDDTVYYKVDWTDDCTFSMQYVSGGKKLSKKVLDFNREHIFWNKIETVTDEYFVSRLYQDRIKGRMLKRDTSWFVQKVEIARHTEFQKISGPLIDKETAFSDSANYALLYVYRPSKVMLLLASYPLYCNNEVMCMVQNNSGYIFRINREGAHQFSTRLLNDQSNISINIEFGKKYFIKPTIDWGIMKNLTNFRLGLDQVDNITTATDEFKRVRLR